MKATQIYKKQNADGTYTYTNENGEVLIAKSKKNYEYAAPAYYSAKGMAFGKYSTCEKALEEYRAHAYSNLKYCEETDARRRERMGIAEAIDVMDKAKAWVKRAENANVIKIETIQ